MDTDCDFLLKYYDMRKVARTGEVDAMRKAKDVLNGASYSRNNFCNVAAHVL